MKFSNIKKRRVLLLPVMFALLGLIAIGRWAESMLNRLLHYEA